MCGPHPWHVWLPKQDLNKEDINGLADVEGGKLTRPQP